MIVREGILHELEPQQQRLFQVTNRSIRDVAFQVETRTANYDRVNEWEKYDAAAGIPSQTSLKVAHQLSLHEISETIKYALQNIKDAIRSMPAPENPAPVPGHVEEQTI